MNIEIMNMIEEHKVLTSRIKNVESQIYGVQTLDNPVDSIEYTNLAIQLRGMKIYREGLEARLTNRGIIIDGDNYYENVTNIEPIHCPYYVPRSDYDEDKQKEETKPINQYNSTDNVKTDTSSND